jgi:hypothetical protein
MRVLLLVVVYFVPFTPRGLAVAVAASLCLDFARAAFAECVVGAVELLVTDEFFLGGGGRFLRD